MTDKIRKIGWMWQWNFLRPLYWKEYQMWIREVLPLGWSIITDPDEGADEGDYEKLIAGQNANPPDTGHA